MHNCMKTKVIKFEKCNMKGCYFDKVYSIDEFWNIMLNYFSVYFRLVLVHWYDKMMRPGRLRLVGEDC